MVTLKKGCEVVADNKQAENLLAESYVCVSVNSQQLLNGRATWVRQTSRYI